MDPLSPLRMGSQVDEQEEETDRDSDVKSEDPNSTSQIHLATQLPLPDIVRTRQQNTGNGTAGTTLLDCLPGMQKPSILPEPSTSSTTQTKGSINQNEYHSSACDLTQRQILVPSSRVPVVDAESTLPQHKQTSVSSQNPVINLPPAEPKNFAEPMPQAVFELLRNWRKECQDGKHIPRRLQIIPKDQEELLESDDKWQPSLVGHPQRQGAVPTALLMELTRRADEVVSPEPIGIQAESTTGEVEQRDVQSLHPEQEQELEDNSSELGSESSKASWPSSPPGPAGADRNLPPDSSPLRPRVTGSESAVQKSSNATEQRTEQQIESLPTRGKDSLGQVSDQIQDVADDPEQLVPSRTSIPSNKSNMPCLSPLATNAEAPRPALQKTVQVKRTPHFIRENLPADNAPESSTNVIPATFDDRAHRFQRDLGNTRKLSHDPRRADDHYVDRNNDDFELNSSEDDDPTRRDSPISGKTGTRLVSTREIEQISRSPTVPANDKNSNAHTTANSKRKDLSSQSHPYKRQRRLEKTSDPSNEVDPDYGTVDQARVQYRREHLSKIARRGSTAKSAIPSREQKRFEAEMTASRSSIRQDTPSRTSPRAQELAGTSDTNISVHQSVNQHKKSESEGTYAHAMASNTKLGADLFEEFQRIYSDYGGQRKHFEAACGLLKNLHSQGKATHQYLWDDFVFRHFHDYRQHLQQAIEDCGNAMSYEKFYDECVEEPRCHRRVIRPAHLSAASVSFLPIGGSGLHSLSTVDQRDTAPGTDIATSPVPNRAGDRDSLADKAVVPEGSSSHHSRHRSSIKRAQEPAQTNETVQAVATSRPQQQSQDSNTSVKLWLERTAGAESPVLGTPVPEPIKDVDIPMLDDTRREETSVVPTSTPASAKQKKRRSLPWPASAQPAGASSRSPGIFARKSMPLASSSSSANKKSAGDKIRTTTAPKTAQAFKPSRPMSSSANPQKQAQEPAVETAFQRFHRLYTELSSEKVAMRASSSPAMRQIDISAWRN